MIKNNSQLTQAKQSLEDLIIKLQAIESPNDLSEQMQHASYECRIDNVKKEIEEYEVLLRSKVLSFDKESLPKIITSLRIASGYTQKALADELELPEQQIQRYEQQEYAKVKFERVVQIIRVLAAQIAINVCIKNDSVIPFAQTPVTQEAGKRIKERGSILNLGA